MGDNCALVWSAVDPLGNVVVLLERTLEWHIVDDHTARDAVFRRDVAQEARRVVEDPFYVMEQGSSLVPGRARRYDYVDLAVKDGQPYIVHVIVDTDRVPFEVTTAIPAKKFKKDEKGVVIYERGTGAL